MCINQPRAVFYYLQIRILGSWSDGSADQNTPCSSLQLPGTPVPGDLTPWSLWASHTYGFTDIHTGETCIHIKYKQTYL